MDMTAYKIRIVENKDTLAQKRSLRDLVSFQNITGIDLGFRKGLVKNYPPSPESPTQFLGTFRCYNLVPPLGCLQDSESEVALRDAIVKGEYTFDPSQVQEAYTQAFFDLSWNAAKKIKEWTGFEPQLQDDKEVRAELNRLAETLCRSAAVLDVAFQNVIYSTDYKKRSESWDRVNYYDLIKARNLAGVMPAIDNVFLQYAIGVTMKRKYGSSADAFSRPVYLGSNDVEDLPAPAILNPKIMQTGEKLRVITSAFGMKELQLDEQNRAHVEKLYDRRVEIVGCYDLELLIGVTTVPLREDRILKLIDQAANPARLINKGTSDYDDRPMSRTPGYH